MVAPPFGADYGSPRSEQGGRDFVLGTRYQQLLRRNPVNFFFDGGAVDKAAAL
jgi:hypothetical protein